MDNEDDKELTGAERRIADLTRKNRDLRKQVDKLQETVDTQAHLVEENAGLKEKLERVEADHQSAIDGMTERLALSNAGVTDEDDQELLRYMFSRYQKDNENAKLTDYLAGPARENKRLAPIFSSEQTGGQKNESEDSEEGDSTGGGTSGAAGSATGNASDAGKERKWTAAAIESLSIEEYEKHRPEIERQMLSGQL